MATQSGQCTSNFVFFDATNVYLGLAAHCAGEGAISETNGCETEVLPLGTPVQIEGATAPGTVVYNSWVTMQENGERNPDACFGNDFALVRLDSADHARVNPSVPFWGGPTGLDPSSSGGESVYSYGSSELRLGLEPLSPQLGVALGQQSGGWNHHVLMIAPGIPGDSGSAYLGSDGGAMGVLSTIAVLPVPLTNYVSDLSRALAYMKAHTDAFDGVELAVGTEPFSPLL
jgi:hypothetical protein